MKTKMNSMAENIKFLSLNGIEMSKNLMKLENENSSLKVNLMET